MVSLLDQLIITGGLCSTQRQKPNLGFSFSFSLSLSYLSLWQKYCMSYLWVSLSLSLFVEGQAPKVVRCDMPSVISVGFSSSGIAQGGNVLRGTIQIAGPCNFNPTLTSRIGLRHTQTWSFCGAMLNDIGAIKHEQFLNKHDQHFWTFTSFYLWNFSGNGWIFSQACTVDPIQNQRHVTIWAAMMAATAALKMEMTWLDLVHVKHSRLVSYTNHCFWDFSLCFLYLDKSGSLTELPRDLAFCMAQSLRWWALNPRN